MTLSCRFTIFCGVLLGFGLPTYGQSEAEFDLGTIVLRGELQDRAIEDSPTSAVVVTGAALERRGDRDLFDIIARTPGINGTFGEAGFNIRGIDQRGVGGAGRGLLVTTQVDGVALPNEFATFFGPYSVWDLDQVEILRGPQSTQQGRNALAGAIILRSKDPTFEREFRLRTEVASRDTHRFALVANTPLIDDRLAVRFSAETFETDGFFTNTLLNEDAGAQSMTTYRAKLLWRPTDRFEAVLSFSHTDNEGGEDTFFGTDPAGPYNVAFDLSNVEGAEQSNFGLRTRYDINDRWQVETETNYYVNDYAIFLPFDGSLIPAIPPSVIQLTNNRTKDDVFEQDVALRFESADISGVVGVFFTQIDSTVIRDISGLQINLDSTNVTGTTNFAVYGEADIRADRWLPGLSFTVGARYDFEEFSLRETNPANTPVTNTASTTFDAFLPKLGATFEITADQRVSFTAQRGYRAGAAQSVQVPGNPGTTSVSAYGAEFANNFEIAYRGSFSDDRLRLAANVFYTKWRDQQVNQVIGFNGIQPITQIVNAGQSELYGLELSMDADVTDALTVFGQATFTETEFTDFVTLSDNLTGNSFPNAPEVTMAFGASYRLGEYYTISGDVAYTDATFSGSGNEAAEITDSYWLVNAQIVYETDNWRVGLYGRNLLDERYAVRRQNFTNAAGTFNLLTVGEPRTVGFYVERSF